MAKLKLCLLPNKYVYYLETFSKLFNAGEEENLMDKQGNINVCKVSRHFVYCCSFFGKGNYWLQVLTHHWKEV